MEKWENDIKSIKSVLKKTVTVWVTGLLPAGSPWETALFQLTGKGTGVFIYPLPIHHCLRAESRGSGLSCLCPHCAPTGRKRPFSRDLQVSSELPEFWMNVRGHELGSDSFCSSFFFCSRSHQPMRDPLSLRSPRDLMPPRLSVTPQVLFTYLSLTPGTVVGTQ